MSEAPSVTLSRIDEDESFSAAVGDFLSKWLVDRDAASAFSYLSTECYSCYNTLRAEGLAAASSDEQAGRLIREQMALVSDAVGAPASLEDVVEGVEPSHPMIRVMTHDNESAYTLASVPTVIRQLASCSYRTSGGSIPDTMPADYGDVAATLFRFRTVSGETPVYRLVWAKLGGEWKITAYDIEDP